MDWPISLIVLLLIANGLAFALFAYDKMSAIQRGWRIRESTLLGLAFLGPFGAYLGMRTFRHKTRKLKFVLVKVFMAMQLLLLVLYLHYFAA
jgi:uncharacterized membrane protein YsdA (DUF1294 family)